MSGGPSSFGIGDRVRVRGAYPPGHVRTPYYVRGRTGVIEGIAGTFPNPEELAYGRDGRPEQALYWVRFRQVDLWPDYAGPAGDTTVVDIFAHWLEPEPTAGATTGEER